MSDPDEYAPIVVRTRAAHRSFGPVAYDCVKVIVIRDGSAIVYSEFGHQPSTVGDVVVLGATTLFGVEPEGHITFTAIDLDTDYVVGQIFWQVGIVRDRLDAHDLTEALYSEPAQILRLGEDRAGMLMPWLDELTALSVEHGFLRNFYRVQALWFDIAHVIAPLIAVSPVRLAATQRPRSRPTLPRYRAFHPLRAEAMEARELLRGSIAYRWRRVSIPSRFDRIRTSLDSRR